MILCFCVLFSVLVSFYPFSCFRYTVAQRSDARRSHTRSTGLPPYRLILSRIVNPFSPPETTTSAGLEIRAADLHGAHRGSRPPTPVIASGEFIYHTTGAPPNDLPLFTHGDHQHQFILEWKYDTEGRFVLRFLVLWVYWGSSLPLCFLVVLSFFCSVYVLICFFF